MDNLYSTKLNGINNKPSKMDVIKLKLNFLISFRDITKEYITLISSTHIILAILLSIIPNKISGITKYVIVLANNIVIINCILLITFI